MNNSVKKIFLTSILFFLSVFLFSINNAFFNWIVFVPVLFLVKVCDFKFVFLWGGLYGFFSYFFYVFWLSNLNFLYLILVCFLYFILWAFLFLCLNFFFEKSQIFLHLKIFLFLCIFEFLKTKGFLGFSFGLISHSQYTNLFLIQISDIFGIWAVDFLMIYSSVLIFKILEDFIKISGSFSVKLKNSFLINRFSSCVFIFLLVFFYSYGIIKVFIQEEEKSSCEKIKIAAIQNNVDPWEDDIRGFSNQIEKLKNLSRKCIEENPDVKIIVWPETAVIPSIEKNYFSDFPSERKKIIENLLLFIDSMPSSFVLGNYNAQKNLKDYNSVYFFTPKENVFPPSRECYSKIHLVPFSEYFPEYLKIWPFTHIFSEENLWEKGSEYKVFSLGDFKFSTPVCFEDNFSSDLIKFVRKGARCFINLSNDSWAKSKRCQVQHLQTAVFRSVENKIYSVRSTSSGETCFISSVGKIYLRSPSFEENYIQGEVYYSEKQNAMYTRFGDFLPYSFIFCFVICMIFSFIAYFRKIK
ncbi:MAG: apolipoprotein N-acyltransferase [Treponema sp.]|nr:apolipoprotein N-acyltransferase [Treponema sp.]